MSSHTLEDISTEYVRSKVLRQTEEEMKVMDKAMEVDRQRIQQEQMAQMAAQQAQQQGQQQ